MKWGSTDYNRYEATSNEAKYEITQQGLEIFVSITSYSDSGRNQAKALAHDIDTFLLWRRGREKMRALTEATEPGL